MRILLVGDVMIGQLVNEALKVKPPTYPWGDTLTLFQRADLRICNLECPIADCGEPWSVTPKLFHFRSDGKNVAALSAAGIDVVSLANNHVLDYGYDALAETLLQLRRNHIRQVGAGTDIAEAWLPAIVDSQDAHVALLAFTDNEPFWEAGDDRPGTCYIPVDRPDARTQRFLSLVASVKSRADYLIVSAHWGANWGSNPPYSHMSLGKSIVDAGADVVFGHSSHVFRGVELYRGRPIIYGVGDFVNNYAVHPLERNDQSMIFVLELRSRAVHEISLFPIVIRKLQARRAHGREALDIALRMQRLCHSLGTTVVWSSPELGLSITVNPEDTRVNT